MRCLFGQGRWYAGGCGRVAIIDETGGCSMFSVNSFGQWVGKLAWVAAVVMFGILAGCASYPQAPARAADAEYNYVIGPGDTVEHYRVAQS